MYIVPILFVLGGITMIKVAFYYLFLFQHELIAVISPVMALIPIDDFLQEQLLLDYS